MNESISMIVRNVMMMCGALIAIIKPTIPFIIIAPLRCSWIVSPLGCYLEE